MEKKRRRHVRCHLFAAIQRIKNLSPTQKLIKKIKILKTCRNQFCLNKNLQICCHPFCTIVPFVTIVTAAGLEAKNIAEAPPIFFQTTKQSITFTAPLPLTINATTSHHFRPPMTLCDALCHVQYFLLHPTLAPSWHQAAPKL